MSMRLRSFAASVVGVLLLSQITSAGAGSQEVHDQVDALTAEARALHERGRHDEAHGVLVHAEELITRWHDEYIRPRLGDLTGEIRWRLEHGQQRQAEQLQQAADELRDQEQRLERWIDELHQWRERLHEEHVRRQGHDRDAHDNSDARREREAHRERRVQRERLPAREPRARHERERDVDSLEQRIHHMRVAAEHLQAAGMEEMAHQVVRAAEELAHQFDERRAERERDHRPARERRPDGEHVEELKAHVEELTGAFHQLRRQMDELREAMSQIREQLHERRRE